MTYLKLAGKEHRGARWSVLDRRCIGKPCLQPGTWQTRGGTPSGSRNTGTTDCCCMRRAYYGCPDAHAESYSKELEAERKKAGWRNS